MQAPEGRQRRVCKARLAVHMSRAESVSDYIGWLVTGITWEGAQDEQHIHTRMDLDGPGGKRGYGRLKGGRTRIPGV